MTKRSGSDGGAKGRDDRAERLAAALRENLRRRKAQSRGREQAPGAEDPASRAPPPGERNGKP